MIRILSIFSFFCFGSILAQPETEVFLMDISANEETVEISNFKNISNNAGYDNQPFFLDQNNLVYAGTRDGATDIAAHNIPSGQNWWLNNPTEGGEYSPQPIPGRQAVSAVRLDPDGLQRLYEYPMPEAPSKVLVEDLKVAYYAYFDKDKIAMTVIVDDDLEFGVYSLAESKMYTLTKKAGRSIHKVPNSDSMSYTVVNEDGDHDIYLLDINDGYKSYFVCQLPVGIQDYAWLDENRMIMGSGSKLYVYDTFSNKTWTAVGDISKYKANEISRISVNADGDKLALAATSLARPAAEVVQAHIAPFNERRLDDFANCFSEDVIVSNFPDKKQYEGRNALKEGYRQYYERVKSSEVKVLKRIVLGSTVIDEEEAIVDGKTYRQATFYKVENDAIAQMTFLQDNRSKEEAEKVVQAQLDAYNARDIDGFVDTYSEDIMIHNYPNLPIYGGKLAMKKSYGEFFSTTPNLHCEIKNRIVIGNKVIDEEYITMNDQNFSAVAVYEVVDGKIAKVTFIR